MDLDIKPNSIMKRDEHPDEIKKVTTGNVVVKKNTGKKLKKYFIAEDASNVKDYILFDLLIPTLKDTIVDVLQGSIEMLFLGTTSSRRRRGGGNGNRNNPGNASYFDYSGRSRVSRPQTLRGRWNFDDVYYETKDDAMIVVDTIGEIIDRYGFAYVADFYNASGVTGNGYTDRAWGWKDFRGAAPIRTRDGGYILDVPEPIKL